MRGSCCKVRKRNNSAIFINYSLSEISVLDSSVVVGLDYRMQRRYRLLEVLNPQAGRAPQQESLPGEMSHLGKNLEETRTIPTLFQPLLQGRTKNPRRGILPININIHLGQVSRESCDHSLKQIIPFLWNRWSMHLNSAARIIKNLRRRDYLNK